MQKECEKQKWILRQSDLFLCFFLASAFACVKEVNRWKEEISHRMWKPSLTHYVNFTCHFLTMSSECEVSNLKWIKAFTILRNRTLTFFISPVVACLFIVLTLTWRASGRKIQIKHWEREKNVFYNLKLFIFIYFQRVTKIFAIKF